MGNSIHPSSPGPPILQRNHCSAVRRNGHARPWKRSSTPRPMTIGPRAEAALAGASVLLRWNFREGLKRGGMAGKPWVALHIRSACAVDEFAATVRAAAIPNTPTSKDRVPGGRRPLMHQVSAEPESEAMPSSTPIADLWRVPSPGFPANARSARSWYLTNNEFARCWTAIQMGWHLSESQG
jgi:hypothetical protein